MIHTDFTLQPCGFSPGGKEQVARRRPRTRLPSVSLGRASCDSRRLSPTAHVSVCEPLGDLPSPGFRVGARSSGFSGSRRGLGEVRARFEMPSRPGAVVGFGWKTWLLMGATC